MIRGAKSRERVTAGPRRLQMNLMLTLRLHDLVACGLPGKSKHSRSIIDLSGSLCLLACTVLSDEFPTLDASTGR
jgi:hypothetical protein